MRAWRARGRAGGRLRPMRERRTVQTSTRVFLNAVTNWAASSVNVAIGVVLVPFLLWRLGTDAYGLTVILGVALLSFLEVADFGLRNALGRQLAEQVAKNDMRRFNELASSATLFYIVLGTLMALVCVLAAPWLVSFVSVPPALQDEAVLLVRWFASATILQNFLQMVPKAALTSANRYDLINAIGVAINIIRGAGLFLILGLTDAGLRGWAAATFASFLVALVLYQIVAYRVQPDMRIRPQYYSHGAMRSLFRLGGSLFTLEMANLMGVRSDPIVLSTFLGPGAVALYAPGAALATSVRPLVNTLANQLNPVATRFHVTRQIGALQAVLTRGTRYTLLMGIAACVMLGVFAGAICQVWLERSVGPDYRTTAMVMMGWAVIDLFAYAAGSERAVLVAMNRLRFAMSVEVTLAVLSLATSIVLVGYTRLGVVAVVIPAIVAGLLRRPILAVYTSRSCGMTAGAYFRSAYLRPLIVLGFLGAAAAGIARLAAPTTVVSLGWCAAGVAMLWVALCWTIGFTAEDRASIGSLLSRARSRLAHEAGRRSAAAKTHEETS